MKKIENYFYGKITNYFFMEKLLRFFTIHFQYYGVKMQKESVPDFVNILSATGTGMMPVR